jgi:aldose 1-epimerase
MRNATTEGLALNHSIVWLRHAGQELGLLPSLGGSVAAWRCTMPHGPFDLWRPWDGTPDLYRTASFAMLPWSNRISGGGFTQDGRFHPMRPNRAGEPYPIHGDGWLQPWALEQPTDDTVRMTLQSHRHDGNPHAYAATQTLRLVPGGLDQSVEVTHLGDAPLPYGLGLHPWFVRTPGLRVQAGVQGVWLSGDDPIPTGYTQALPPDWDLNAGIAAHGSFIDNGFGGWQGQASLHWPEHGLRLTLATPEPDADAPCCLVYRPPHGPALCFEPITHPIDAFHMPGRPGLRVLAQGESMRLAVQWRFEHG